MTPEESTAVISELGGQISNNLIIMSRLRYQVRQQKEEIEKLTAENQSLTKAVPKKKSKK